MLSVYPLSKALPDPRSTSTPLEPYVRVFRRLGHRVRAQHTPQTGVVDPPVHVNDPDMDQVMSCLASRLSLSPHSSKVLDPIEKLLEEILIGFCDAYSGLLDFFDGQRVILINRYYHHLSEPLIESKFVFMFSVS